MLESSESLASAGSGVDCTVDVAASVVTGSGACVEPDGACVGPDAVPVAGCRVALFS